MRTKKFILISIMLILFVGGCTTKKIAQVVYDSVKSGECMKTQGKALCDPNK
jgi:outer membrane lipoprotein-sorting protein